MGTVSPFGHWPSALSEAAVASARGGRSELRSDGAALYWIERRPDEGGRQVVVRSGLEGAVVEVTPAGTSVRSRVHEYGGGAYCALPGPLGAVAYVDQGDQRVHVAAGGEVTAVSPAPPEGARWNHGDLQAVPGGRFLLAVRERVGEGRELVAFDLERPGEATVVWSGPDFVAAPRPDAGGRRLAWISWDHPDMSWDASELWVGDLEADDDRGLSITAARRVDGGRGARSGPGEDSDVSVGQPVWLPDGDLLYVSDAGGWWQPWRWSDGAPPRRLSSEPAEWHGPDWALGQTTMAVLADGMVACRRRRDGIDELVLLDSATGALTPLRQPCVSVSAVCAHGGGLAWLGATPFAPAAPWFRGADDPLGPPRPVVADRPLLDSADVSVAEPFVVAGSSGRTVHGLFYPPRSSRAKGPTDECPPVVVVCHGGPTGSAEAGFDPVVQLFTTRGLAVAAVDYAGSAGYGRAYRGSLWGSWGVADVDDCVDVLAHLGATGRVDASRAAIRGGSAGGLTALAALVRSDAFAAAVSWYGVTDLLALVAVTHDFESRYTDRLVGPLPEAADEYRRRSPVNRVDEMHGAVLLLQGLDDPVVPASQAEAVAAALERRGVRCELLTFAGESHGFRRAETIEACLEAELAFYRELLAPP